MRYGVHHDYKGSLEKAAEKPYRKFIKETYGTDGAVLPKKEELSRMRSIFEKRGGRDGAALSPEVVFFADERGYSNLLSGSPQLPAITETGTAMGNTGVPYDTYAVDDADAVLKKYKAAVFVMPIPSEAVAHAIELCRELGIPYLTASAEHPALFSIS